MDKYSGWYSVKDEAYYQEKELIKDKDGNFVTTDGGRVDWVEEESYFFKLSNGKKNSLIITKKIKILCIQNQDLMKLKVCKIWTKRFINFQNKF